MMRIVREFLGNHSLPPLGSVCDCCHIVTLEKVATQEEAVWFSVVNLGAGIRFYLFFDNLEEDGFLRSLSFFHFNNISWSNPSIRIYYSTHMKLESAHSISSVAKTI